MRPKTRPLLLFIFCLFQANIINFLQPIYVQNVHAVFGARTQTLEHESPPITTRPRLPPNHRATHLRKDIFQKEASPFKIVITYSS